MDEFDKRAIKFIQNKLTERLERNLTESEIQVFSMARSGIAYEMIIDFISDTDKSKRDIELYVMNVVDEYKQKHF